MNSSSSLQLGTFRKIVSGALGITPQQLIVRTETIEKRKNMLVISLELDILLPLKEKKK